MLGISLGGWLAGLMATRPTLQPNAVVTWSGLLDPLTYPDHRVGTRLLGREYRDCPTAWEQASPQVLADQYTSPWLVAQSPDERVPLDQGELCTTSSPPPTWTTGWWCRPVVRATAWRTWTASSPRRSIGSGPTSRGRAPRGGQTSRPVSQKVPCTTPPTTG